MKNRIGQAAGIVLMVIVLGCGIRIGIVKAQGPADGPGMPGSGVRIAGTAFAGFGLACSTTNYTDVAAKALGMDSAALRQALVGGKTLEQIASSRNVALQTVTDALNAAYKTDLDQALKDGLITQQEYDQMKNMLGITPSGAATPPAPNAVPGQSGSAGIVGKPGGLMLVGPAAAFPLLPPFNEVKPFVEASKALGMSCADLVKATQSGQSVAQVAVSKNISAQTVIDALVNAAKTAIAQDLKEGLISQIEADRRTTDSLNWAGTFLYQTNVPHLRVSAGPGGDCPGALGGLILPQPLPANPR